MDTYMDSPKNLKKPALIIGGVMVLLSFAVFAFMHFSGEDSKTKKNTRSSENPFAHTTSPIASIDPNLCTDSGAPSLAWRDFPKDFLVRSGASTPVSWQACGFLRSGSVRITLVSSVNKETILGVFPAAMDFANITIKDVLYQSGYRLRIQNDSKNAAFEAYSSEFPVVRFVSGGVTLPMDTWQKSAFKKTSFYYPGDWSLAVHRESVPIELLTPPIYKSKNVLFTEADKRAQKELEEKWRAEVVKKGYVVDQYGRISGKELGYTISPPKDTLFQGDAMVQVGDHIIVGDVPQTTKNTSIYSSKTVKGISFSIPYSASEQAWKVYDTMLRSVGTTRTQTKSTDSLGTAKPSTKKVEQVDTTDALGGDIGGDALGN
jgi:hypothetical protein